MYTPNHYAFLDIYKLLMTLALPLTKRMLRRAEKKERSHRALAIAFTSQIKLRARRPAKILFK